MTSRLAQMQAKFQQKQIQEREEKLLRLYENQQQKAIEKINRGSAGSNTSLGSTGGKVRQMFDERRQKAGIDKSYPLEPLKATKPRPKNVQKVKKVTTTTISSSIFGATRNAESPIEYQEVRRVVADENDEDFGKTFNRPDYDLINMMNNHNLVDALDDIECPDLASEDLFSKKLSNVSTKLPSENAIIGVESSPVRSNRTVLGKTFRVDTKPAVKRTVKSNSSSPTTRTNPQINKTSNPISSPTRSPTKTMNARSKTSTKNVPPQSTQSENSRAPSSNRPSAKQCVKSPVVRDDLKECRYCGRRFAIDRLERHETVCGNTNKKKRKIYDATRHRLQGTELEPYVKRGKNINSKSSNKQAPKKDWRRTHEEFINAIRAAKTAQAHVAKGGKLSDLPPPPPSSNPDYVQCPHCGRKFNEAAAERHIPKCANFIFNKPKPGAPPKARTAKNMR